MAANRGQHYWFVVGEAVCRQDILRNLLQAHRRESMTEGVAQGLFPRNNRVAMVT
jgi:hypothetical protein